MPILVMLYGEQINGIGDRLVVGTLPLLDADNILLVSR
jgi:hypothetical protein